jgi:hypothetical protein
VIDTDSRVALPDTDVVGGARTIASHELEYTDSPHPRITAGALPASAGDQEG